MDEGGTVRRLSIIESGRSLPSVEFKKSEGKVAAAFKIRNIGRLEKRSNAAKTVGKAAPPARSIKS